MTINKLVFKIRKGEGPVYGKINQFAKAVLHFDVPAFRFIYLPLGVFHTFCTITLRRLLQKLYYEPIFKTKCRVCGVNIRLEKGIPQISENLNLHVGDNVTINGVNSFFSASINENPEILIDNDSYIGFQASISAAKKVIIGKNCIISTRVSVMDNSNHPIDPEKRKRLEKVSSEEISPVIIEDNVFIGYQAFIGKGVRVGEGAVIEANSVVIKDVPPYSIMLGCPAIVVGTLKEN